MNRKLSKGFTLVEIMIVVAIIAILAAVAIPNFVKYRKQSQATACIANLKQIQSAVEQMKLGGGALGTDTTANWTTLVGSDKYIKNHLYCPADKTKTDASAYSLGDDTTNPTCLTVGSTGDFPHALPN